MDRIILSLLIILTISGCGKSITVKTEVQESLVEVWYSPAPPMIPRPELPIQNMTDEELQQDGMVVKYYKATVLTLIGYSEELQAALNKYDDINKKYNAEREKIEKGIADSNADKGNEGE